MSIPPRRYTLFFMRFAPSLNRCVTHRMGMTSHSRPSLAEGRDYLLSIFGDDSIKVTRITLS